MSNFIENVSKFVSSVGKFCQNVGEFFFGKKEKGTDTSPYFPVKAPSDPALQLAQKIEEDMLMDEINLRFQGLSFLVTETPTPITTQPTAEDLGIKVHCDNIKTKKNKKKSKNKPSKKKKVARK